LWVFAVFPVGGCAEVTGPPPGTAPVRIIVNPWLGLPVGLDDVELCETGTTNCVTTDANGNATLWLPVGETSFTRRKEGYGSYLIPLVNPADGSSHESAMGSEATLESLHEDVMSPYPLGNMGRISCAVLPGFEGATFDLFDATGKLMAKRYYTDEGSTPTWRLDLTATTTTGSGGFLEVSPGDDYQVQFGGTADDCVHLVAWPGHFVSNTIRFPVRAGHITQITAGCSKKEP
jgi:hypothetical protein